MKALFSTILFLCSGLILCGQQAEKIYSITKIQKNYTYYSQQAELWEKELKNTQKNPDAWLNYYTAARMNNMFAGKDGSRYDMNVIAEELKKNLPNSFEYEYVCYKQQPNTEASYLHILKAYTIDPDRYETWDAFITKAEFEGDTEAMKLFFEKYYQHETYSPGITAWNYNALIGLAPDAILITFGDNDTYPLWFLQQNRSVRKDVQVLNASLLVSKPYRDKMFALLNLPAFNKQLEDMNDYERFRDELMEHVFQHSKRPTYIGISAPKNFRNKHQDNLFITGLTFKYSKQDFDHVAVIRNNYENLFLTDYLKTNLANDFSQSVVDYMSQQYIPCLTVLYKHYVLSGESRKAEDLEQLLTQIGSVSNRTQEISNFLAKVKSH